MLEWIEMVYKKIEELNLTPAHLMIAIFIFFVIQIFAMREAAAWFFKTNSIRKEIKNLRASLSRIEEEVKSLRSLMNK